MAKTLIILLTFYLIGWFLFTYKLTDVPPGINGDEAAIGYLASLIAKTGHDSEGKFLPLFTTLSWPDWKQPITMYSTVATFKIFGTSFFNLRAVSVIFVLLGGTIIFFLAKEVYGEKLAILSLSIFATTPIVMIQAHLAIENIAPLPFVAIWLWMLAKYTNIKKRKYLFFAALALGISLYSYLGLRLIVPVLTIISICYIYYLNRSKKNFFSPILIFILTLVPFLILMFAIRSEYPAAILASNRSQNITSYQQFLLPFISSFDLSFLFMKGDFTPYHSTGRQGMFLLATLPLFLLGLFKIASKRKPFFILVLLVFFLTPILYGLPGSIYRASRLLALLPSFIIITLIGISSLLEIKRKLLRLLIVTLFTVLIFLNYADFVLDYWGDYSNRVNQDFEKPLHNVFDYVAKLSQKEDLRVFIQDDAPLRNPAVYLFFENSYFPKGLPRWKEGQSLPEKSAVLVSAQVYHRLKKPDYIETIDNGSMDLNLLINRTNENE